METVTVQVATKPISVFRAVIVALPAANALTRPLLSTVATAVLLLLHVTALYVASVGKTVAVNVSFVPDASDKVVLLSVTLTTGMETVTAQLAVLLPSAVVAVTVAFPPDRAVTTPLAFTEATAGLLLVHDTFLFVALEGVIVGIRVSVAPTVSVVLGLSVTPVTATVAGVTVTLTLAESFPSGVATVIVASPGPTAFTTASFAAVEVI